MAEDSSSQSFLRRHWEGYKEFWGERFSFLENYSKSINRDKPLPSWSSSDVEEFIASDPVHGPTLKTTREAVNYGLTGSIIGAVSTAGVAWNYSRSLHGAGLSLLAGGIFGWTFGHEIANHTLQLYRLDTLAAETKFLEWWENKSAGRS
ncbi:Succinate dehydrogenase subunit 6, mitochondrial [Parasponia andersonii]|uniref:Succinate dehydrogenase subunit 6, mitochondrial n=1 Tax=Parasponia andersonii TaxID=3476 RepID=A0A2P5BQ20_PARAD|nr:Succinate dehydrogenase subunit 6, mitochondrial [Parasponia andersonii]